MWTAKTSGVTFHEERDDYASWHPDGQRIIFVEREGRFDLYLMDVPTKVNAASEVARSFDASLAGITGTARAGEADAVSHAGEAHRRTPGVGCLRIWPMVAWRM